MPSHYDTLQVIPSANNAVIKAAYRALAQLYHPDLYPDSPDAEASMKDINLAYQILSNTSSRAQYDMQQGFGDYSFNLAYTVDFREENFSAAPVQQNGAGQSHPSQEYDRPQYFHQETSTPLRAPSWMLRGLFFVAAIIFSLMVAAKWLVVSNPDLAYGAGNNATPELKLRLDTSPLIVPEY
jgi:curved DNA-binding protein CbpA